MIAKSYREEAKRILLSPMRLYNNFKNGGYMHQRLPEMLKKYFWDCDFEEINMDRYAFFIAERILNFGDMDSLKWLTARTDKAFLREVVRKSRNLDKKTRNYWKMVLYDNEPAY